MKTISVEHALRLEDTVFIDVRTESEYNEDNILEAINMPLFKDDEHKDVGTIYKTQSKHDAIQKGFEYVSIKLKDIYIEINELSKKYSNIIIYCARGGMRSTSVANLLYSLGMNVFKLEGGYKAYRSYVIEYLGEIMKKKNFIVVHGLTGVGKTDLLNSLDSIDIDVIDLEGIAKNKGSTFGFIGFDEKPPSQKKFESKIFNKLYYSNSDYIFIESESKRVGHVIIPSEIYDAMTRDGYHIILECSVDNRVKRLYKDYFDNKEENIGVLRDCINKFRKRLGNSKVEQYISLLDEGRYEVLVEKYLIEYYDPLYLYSVNKYSYNKVINYDNEKIAINECIDFHKSAVEGAKKC